MYEQAEAGKEPFALCSEEVVDFGSRDLQLHRMVGWHVAYDALVVLSPRTRFQTEDDQSFLVE